jgi:hypothetical protein
MRLIDADALEKVLQKRSNELMDENQSTISGALMGAICFVVTSPTINAMPVNQGEWTTGYFQDIVCTACTHPSTSNTKTSYCPHCGARMATK